MKKTTKDIVDSTTIISKILKKTEAIKSDDKNANKLPDILKLSLSSKVDVVVCCCNALGDIMSHFMCSHHFFDTSKIAVAEEDLSKEDQFSSWLKEKFSAACSILCIHLEHQRNEVKVASLAALVSILQAGNKFCQQPAYMTLVENMLSSLTNPERNQCEVLEELPKLLSEDDKGEEHSGIALACLSYVKKTLKHSTQAHTDIFLTNFWHLIKNIASQDLDDKSRRMLTAAVCDFLKLKIPNSLYRDILTGLSAIMEKMSSPIRLADFLSESFNIGGAISLLSLHGLFILMHKYNLDYPDFYNKLYSMFEPQVFGAKYRARFFHLAETFLSSTHLPAYLVAAFAKRLARLALHAPIPGSHIAVPFILNLMHRHPACEVMLHRPDHCSELDSDPFLPEEQDTSKCRAIDSCLWELQTLEHHYDPSLSLQARKRHIAERDLAPLLDTTYSDIFSSEAKKIKSEVAVTFVKPSGLELPTFFTL